LEKKLTALGIGGAGGTAAGIEVGYRFRFWKNKKALEFARQIKNEQRRYCCTKDGWQA
jgi:hypothetical protein